MQNHAVRLCVQDKDWYICRPMPNQLCFHIFSIHISLFFSEATLLLALMGRYFFAARKYTVSTTFLHLPLLQSQFQHRVSGQLHASCSEEFRETIRHFFWRFERSFARMIVWAWIHRYRETGPRFIRSGFMRSGFMRSLQEVYLDVMRGRINIFSILISSSPGKEK